MSDFLDFRLVVSKILDDNTDNFVAFVADAPVDRSYCSFKQLVNIEEHFRGMSYMSVRCDSDRSCRIVPQIPDGQLTDRQYDDIGRSLFRFLFPEGSEIHDLFVRSCERATITNKYLRLRLELHHTLSDLPWEMILCPIHFKGAAAIKKAQVSIIRYMGDTHLENRRSRKKPGIVIIKANKKVDMTEISDSFTREVDIIVNILKRLPVRYDIIQRSNTRRGLGEVINRFEEDGNPVIGLHFIGHGGMDEIGSYFAGNESEDLTEQKLYVDDIHRALDAAQSIQWVIINACYAGYEPVGNPLAGLATSISVLKSVPTVIAYKRAVHTKDAEMLAAKFFENVLSKGSSIERVVREMQVQKGNPGGLVVLQRSIAGKIQETIDLGAYGEPEATLQENNSVSSNFNLNREEEFAQSAAVTTETFYQMVRIPSGLFRKGLTQEQIHSLIKQFKKQGLPLDEQSVRTTLSSESEATIDLPEFLIDIYPITNEQYSKFIKDTNIRTDAEREGLPDNWRKYAGPGKGKHPVVCVSKNDALTYCKWAGKRLPTANEWVKAYRGPSGRIYPWGDDFDINKCNTAETMRGWETTPVDKYIEGISEYGCYDMVGNVEELTDSTDEEGNVIILGGSWSMTCQVYGLPVLRRQASPDFYSNDMGFRCAK